MLNAEERLLYKVGRHVPRVVLYAPEIVYRRRESLKRGIDDRTGIRSYCQRECRSPVDISSIAVVVGIEAEAECTIGKILRIAGCVKNAKARPDGPLVAG